MKSQQNPLKSKPTVVGIGASVGSLAALKTLFSHMPADSGLTFVVVVHLAPDYESHLAELLQPHVAFPVEQVNDSTALQANHWREPLRSAVRLRRTRGREHPSERGAPGLAPPESKNAGTAARRRRASPFRRARWPAPRSLDEGGRPRLAKP